MYIVKYLQWNQGIIKLNGKSFINLPFENSQALLTHIYQHTKVTYPKFFKMDMLSKLAFLSLEILSPDLESINKNRAAVVLSTHSGSIEVDTKFEESRQAIASPALFVYTLPNIMLGEICIRMKLKGAQMCFIEEKPNPDLLYFYVSDLLGNRDSDGCICGHVEARENSLEATMVWVTSRSFSGSGIIFSPENLRSILI